MKVDLAGTAPSTASVVVVVASLSSVCLGRRDGGLRLA